MTMGRMDVCFDMARKYLASSKVSDVFKSLCTFVMHLLVLIEVSSAKTSFELCFVYAYMR